MIFKFNLIKKKGNYTTNIINKFYLYQIESMFVPRWWSKLNNTFRPKILIHLRTKINHECFTVYS